MIGNQLSKGQERNPAEIAVDLKNYLFELTNIVVRENDFLEQQQIDEVLRIIPIKLEILEQIKAFETELKSNSSVKDLDIDVKKSLIDTHLNLCNLLTINHSKLEIAKSINYQIINMISDHLIENKRQEHVYNSGGEILSQNTEYKYMPPLTFNQKV